MPDLPITPTVSLNAELSKVLKASTAVREGIATHAQKHAAARSAQHEALEADRKLAQQK